MSSQFESARNTEIRTVKKALRAHAIDQNNTRRTPERVIALLEEKGHKDAPGFLTRILTDELTGKDRGIIRKIDASAIPAVTPVKAPEEPIRRLRDTSGLKTDPHFDKYRRDMSSSRIARRTPASPAPEARESIPAGHVMVNLSSLVIVGERGAIISEETWNNIKLLRSRGTLHIEEIESAMGNEVRIFYTLSPQQGQNYSGNYDRNGSIDESIGSLVQELRSNGVLPAEENLESPKPSTVRIHLSTLTVCDSKNSDEGVEVSLLTLGEIQELQKIGTLTITKSGETGYFRCRLAGKVGGGRPWVGTNQKLEYAVAVLVDQLRHAGKYPASSEQAETAPADTVEIDINDVTECPDTAKGPGVVKILRKTLEDIERLQIVGELKIFATKEPNKFTLLYEDFIGHIDRVLLLVGIDEGIARLVPEAEHFYAEEMKV